MGKVLSVITKPIREFNIENRAHKVISREKPIPAPKYKADAVYYEQIKKEHPEFLEETTKKHEQLDKHLKQVYVKSFDPPISQVSQQSVDRPLPVNRNPVEDFEFGFKEPEKVPVGKVTLRKALRFINEHQVDPKTYTATKIAEDHHLPEETVKNILKYFRVFEMYVPDNQKGKVNFFGPYVPRKEIIAHKRKALPLSKDDKDKT